MVDFSFVVRMCAAFSLGKLQFGHVLSRCVGHVVHVLFLLVHFCDRFVVTWPLWGRDPLQQEDACQGSPVTGEPLQHWILLIMFSYLYVGQV